MKPISWYKSLSVPKLRRERGCFLIEGRRAVEQVLMHHRYALCELLCTDDTVAYYESSTPKSSVPESSVPKPSAPKSPIIESPQNELHSAPPPIRVISAANMKSICAAVTPQGVAAVVRIPDGVYTSKVPDASTIGERILLLEHLQDPGNVGTLVRTAAAFGVSGAILSGQCADPFSPKAVQSSAGSLLSLWIRRSDGYLDMVDELKGCGYKLIAGDLEGTDLHNVNNIIPHILALGSEGAGLSRELIDRSDYRVRIPIVESGAESLNVAASGAILMFMLRPKLRALRSG